MSKKNTQRLFIYPLLLILVLVLSWSHIQAAFFNNGFDLAGSLIDPEEIHHGGPPKDGIPAIDHPKFVRVSQADFMRNEDRVLGLNLNGIAKAYPIKILNYHEIVNDMMVNQEQSEAVLISYCPLCGSGVAFSSHINGKNSTFGVSGLLYNSDVLLYDRQTESLWSQIMAKSISGPLKGQTLEILNLSHTSWQDWKKRYPESLVLSTNTGYLRDYESTPYQGYDKSKALYFPVANLDKRYHPKEYVLGVEVNGQFKAYPFAELSQSASPLIDNFAGQKIKIRFNTQHRSAELINKPENSKIKAFTSFWFAWMAFHPHSEVFQHQK